MKKLRALSLLLTVFLFLSVFSFSSLSAATATPTPVPISTGGSPVFVSVDDETGKSNSGLPNYISSGSKNSNIMALAGMDYGLTLWTNSYDAGSNITVYEKALSTGYSILSKVRVRYLTASWANASSYAWSSANTVGWTIGSTVEYRVADAIRAAIGLSASRTTTYSIVINIPADSTRLNKLGFASDYCKQNFSYYKTALGNIVLSYVDYIKTPTANTYLLVYYK